ncbi:MAG: hypothetical protein A2X52_15310 [Candidatus Rokubacteria bacterium GWC2_70_16]|nr:MAG: hypothetical protein A2X52_15310 [Candidatus Rokubacteria bacterium GWC2_70_16]
MDEGRTRAVTPAWAVEFHEDSDADCPVRDFLDALDRRRAKIVAVIGLLAERGPTLPFPYSSHVRGKVRELRAHYGKERYRVLYFAAPDGVFVLLHALRKSSSEIPEGDVRIAEGRMKRYLEQREGG